MHKALIFILLPLLMIGIYAQENISPRELKQRAIGLLESIETNNKFLKLKIKVIKRQLEESLSIFLDDYRIKPPVKGEFLFKTDYLAIKALELCKKQSIPQNIKQKLEDIISLLVQSDQEIARFSLDIAEMLVDLEVGKRELIQKAKTFFKKGLREKDFADKVKLFKDSWVASQRAIDQKLFQKIIIAKYEDNPDPFSPILTQSELKVGIVVNHLGFLYKQKFFKSKYTLETNWIIKDSSGNIVRTLQSNDQMESPPIWKPGSIKTIVSLSWDGKNDAGNLVADGNYSYLVFAQLKRKPKNMVHATSFPAVGNILVDATPPIITNISPADNETIINPKPTLSASFADLVSGIDLTKTKIFFNEINITEQANTNNNGFSFTSSNDLQSKQILKIIVQDNAGNKVESLTTFTIENEETDVTPPTIINLQPEDQSFLATLNPDISAQFSDDESGIDVNEVRIIIDGNNVTSQANMDENSFSLNIELTEGIHNVLISVKDLAGNEAQANLSFTLDITAPTIIANLSSDANTNGWHKENVTISFEANDNIAIEDVSPQVTISTEGESQEIIGTATDKAGNSSNVSVSINLDKTAPEIAANLSQNVNTNGWHKEDVTVSFEVDDNLSGITDLPQDVVVSTEGENQQISATITDLAGNTNTATISINLDKTAPEVVANLSQQPNTNGWHKEDVTVLFEVNDNLSGVTDLPQDVIVGTEGENQQISATVTDLAGNTNTTAISINLDKTAPEVVANLSQQPNENGWYKEDVTISFVVSDNLSGIDEQPQDVIVNTEGENQQISTTVTDLAGNSNDITTIIHLDKTAPLLTLKPKNGDIVNKKSFPLVAQYNDNISGINLDSVRILVSGEDVTFASTVVPTGASFDMVDKSDDEYRFITEVSDLAGNQTSEFADFEIAVNPFDTRVRGRVVNLDYEPLENIRVKIGEFNETFTDSNGEFELFVSPGRLTLLVDGIPEGYAFVAEPVEIEAGITVLEREIYLPLVNLEEKGIDITGVDNVILTSPDVPGVEVHISAGSLKNPDGSLYIGKLMLLEVPQDQTPLALPEDFEPELVIAVQPGGLVLDPPARVVMPNLVEYPENIPLSLWSMNPNFGIFQNVGQMKVLNGQIDTTSGGMNFTAWHFPSVAPPTIETVTRQRNGNFGNAPEETQPDIGNASSSTRRKTKSRGFEVKSGNGYTDISTGNFSEMHSLPEIKFLDKPYTLNLEYNSSTANPQEIIEFNVTLPEDENRIVFAESIEEVITVNNIPHSITTRSTRGIAGNKFRLATALNLSKLETGQVDINQQTKVYYQSRNGFSRSMRGASTLNRALLVNLQNSPFGAGWGLNLPRLNILPTKNLLLTQGNDSRLLFKQGGIGSPESLDLRDWEQKGNGVWTLSGDRKTVTQLDQSDPTFFLNPDAFIDVEIKGFLRVTDQKDNDFIGFVFGYKNEEDFYIFDWKKEDETEIIDGKQVTAEGKFRLSKVNGLIENPKSTFWTHEGFQPFPTFDDSTGSGFSFGGWNSNQLYEFSLVYKKELVQIYIDSLLVAEITGQFEPGRFGFYNYSQPEAGYLASTNFNIGYISPRGDFSTLEVSQNTGNYARTFKDGTVHTFNQQGLLVESRDKNDNTFIYEYEDKNISTITTPVGGQYTFNYDTNGKISSIQDPAGRITLFFVNSQGDLKKITNPDETTREFDYNDKHLMTSQKDERQLESKYKYDECNALVETTRRDNTKVKYRSEITQAISKVKATEVPTPPSPAQKAEDTFGSYIDGNNANTANPSPTVQIQSDTNGSITDIVNANGVATSLERDENSLVTRSSNLNNARTSMRYDEKGNVIEIQQDDLIIISTMKYDPKFNIMVEMKDPRAKIHKWELDERGNALVYTDPLENKTIYTYNSRGLVSSMTDARNLTTNYEYNSQGNLEKTTYPNGTTQFITYDPSGSIATIKDRLNNTTIYFFDSMNRLKTITDAENQLTRFEYDDNDNLKLTIDAEQRQTIREYDNRDRLQKVIDPDNFEIIYAYDNNNNVISIKNKRGKFTYFEYDALNRRIKTIRKVGDTSPIADADDIVTTTVYDNEGNIIKEIDPRNIETEMKYDSANRLTEIARATGVLEITTKYDYDKASNIREIRDAEDNFRFFEYDDLNRKTKDIVKINDALFTPDADDIVSEYEYDSVGNIVKIRDPENKIIYNEYDNLNRLNKIIQKVGDTQNIVDENDAVTTILYDAMDNVTGKIYPNDVFERWEYDNIYRVKLATNGDGEKTENTYDTVGNVKKTKLPNGNEIFYEHDKLNRLKKITDTIGLVSSYTYDEEGNLLTTTDGNSNTNKNIYDDINRPFIKIDGEGRPTVINYDKNSNVTSIVDRNEHVTSFAYDAINRKTSETNANGGIKTYKYDDLNNLLSATDEKQQTTSYKYDDAYRLTLETYANGTTKQYTYNKVNKVTSRIDQNNRLTTYIYNDLHQLILRDYQEDSDETFIYDKAHRVLSATKADWEVSFTYDGANRVTQTTQNGKLVTCAYNTEQRNKQLLYPSNLFVAYNKDVRGRITNIKEDSLDNPNSLISCEYDLGNRETDRTYKNGASSIWLYDKNNRTTSIEHHKNGLIAGYGYTYDHNDNLSTTEKAHLPAFSEKYVYDAQDRLREFESGTLSGTTINNPKARATFAIDAVDNWDSVTTDGTFESRNHNEVNETTTINGAQLTHDDNGNTTDDRDLRYIYDQENRIREVRSKTTGGLRAEYQYDALGRRIRKTTAEGISFFYYNNWQVLEERDDNDNLVNLYIDNMKIDDHLIERKFDTNGNQTQELFYHTNQRGDTVAITNTAGVVANYEYSPYGEVFSINENHELVAADTTAITYTFQGRRIDHESSLMYFRNRHYSPTLGRFMQRDPMGYEDSMSLYEAFKSNPYKYSDPTGEFINFAVGAFIGFGADIAIQLLTEGKVNWTQALLSGVAGGISGGFGSFVGKLSISVGAKMLSIAAGEAVISTVQAGLQAYWDNEKEYSWGDAGRDFLINFGVGWAFSKIGDKIGDKVKSYFGKSSKLETTPIAEPENYLDSIAKSFHNREYDRLESLHRDLSDKITSPSDYITLYRREDPDLVKIINNDLKITPYSNNIPKTKGGMKLSIEDHITGNKNYPEIFKSFSHSGVQTQFNGTTYTLKVTKQQFRDHFLFGTIDENEVLLIGSANVRSIGHNAFELVEAFFSKSSLIPSE